MMAAMGGFQVVNDSDPKKRCEDFRDSRYDPCGKCSDSRAITQSEVDSPTVAAESHFSTIISVSTFELTSEVIEANDSEYDPCGKCSEQLIYQVRDLQSHSGSRVTTLHCYFRFNFRVCQCDRNK